VNEDEVARTMLRPLDTAPPRPSRVDVGRLITVGRRLRRRRQLAAGSGIALSTAIAAAAVPVILAVTSPTGPVTAPPTDGAPSPNVTTEQAGPLPPPTSCTASRLNPPVGTTFHVHDGDSTGRFLVGVSTVDGRDVPLLWDNGQFTVLQPPVDHQSGRLVVNARGDVAGTGDRQNGPGVEPVLWVYRDGTYTILPQLDGYVFTEIVDMNDRGDILGRGFQQDSLIANIDNKLGVVWSGSDLTPTVLPKPAPVWTTVHAIDNDGTVVGTVGSPHRASMANSMEPLYALVWAPDGTVWDLPAPAGYGPGTGALSVRDGWVLGGYEDPAGGRPGNVAYARWHLPSGLVEPLGDQWRAVSVINRHGWYVGEVEVDGERWAAVGYGGEPLLLPRPEGLGPGMATVISDDGMVIAGTLATSPDPARQSMVAVRWLCS